MRSNKQLVASAHCDRREWLGHTRAKRVGERTASEGNSKSIRNHWPTGTNFTPHSLFILARLQRTADGGVLVAMTNDEENPAVVYPFSNSELWHYGGFKVTQFWRKSANQFRNDLQVAVNARYTYRLFRRLAPAY